jgi:hypothetical protein
VTASVTLALEDAAVRRDAASCAGLVEWLGLLCDALAEATLTLSLDNLAW